MSDLLDTSAWSRGLNSPSLVPGGHSHRLPEGPVAHRAHKLVKLASFDGSADTEVSLHYLSYSKKIPPTTGGGQPKLLKAYSLAVPSPGATKRLASPEFLQGVVAAHDFGGAGQLKPWALHGADQWFSGEKLTARLGRLQPGWAGPGSAAPNDSMLRDLLTVSYAVPPGALAPDVEVDPDDGAITLLWTSYPRQASFALIFNGGARVLGVLAARDGTDYEPWALSVERERELAYKLESDDLLGILY